MSHPVVPDHEGPEGERVIGIIDLGSNSLRLMLVRVLPDGSHTVLNQVKNMVRLGEGAFETGHLREESMARTINVLRGMAEMCAVYAASEVIAIATAAVRDAVNGPDFMRRVREKTGIDFRVVSGREEARLIYLGVSSGLAHTESLRLFIDIGGGSTELVVGNSEEYRNLDSLKMGCVRLSNLFFDKDSGTISARRYAALQTYIRNNALRSFQRIADFVIEEAVASSGTAQNLAEIAAALDAEDAARTGRAPQESRDVLSYGGLRRAVKVRPHPQGTPQRARHQSQPGRRHRGRCRHPPDHHGGSGLRQRAHQQPQPAERHPGGLSVHPHAPCRRQLPSRTQGERAPPGAALPL